MKRKPIWILGFIGIFLVAIALSGFVGFWVGIKASEKDKKDTSEDSLYKSSCTVYFATKQATSGAISSSDLAGLLDIEQITSILQSEAIRSAISAQYPQAEYELTLQQVNSTEIVTITATSNYYETNLANICNLAVTLMCEELEKTGHPQGTPIGSARQPKP